MTERKAEYMRLMREQTASRSALSAAAHRWRTDALRVAVVAGFAEDHALAAFFRCEAEQARQAFAQHGPVQSAEDMPAF